MGILKKFKKTAPIPPAKELKKGVIEKAQSVIMAVPRNAERPADMDAFIGRVRGGDGLEIFASRAGAQPRLIAGYEGEEYTVDFCVEEDFKLPELFRIFHDFTEEDSKIMEDAGKALLTRMIFREDNMKSYHLQLKVLTAMLPDMAGIVDYSSERFLSGRWASLAAAYKVPPAPSYLYTPYGEITPDSVYKLPDTF